MLRALARAYGEPAWTACQLALTYTMFLAYELPTSVHIVALTVGLSSLALVPAGRPG